MDYRSLLRTTAAGAVSLSMSFSIFGAPSALAQATSGAPASRYVATSPAFTALPRPIQSYVTERRQGCIDTYAFLPPQERAQYNYIPADDMAGIHETRLAGRRAIIVDNFDLCTSDVVGGNCNNRGCPVSVWLEMDGGSWRKLPVQDSRLELDPSSRDPVWLEVVPRYRDARCKADAAADGCGLRWRFQRVEAAKKIPRGAASPAAADTQPAPATPSAGGTGTAVVPAVAARWTYGRHPALGQSAHVTIGAEALGFACIEGDGGWTVSYRMTPGLVPGVKQPETSVVGIFLKPFQISGGGQFSSNPAGFVEQKQDYCTSPIASYRSADSVLLVDGQKLGFTADGPRVVMEIEQNGRHFTISREEDVGSLVRSVPVPLAGSSTAITQLIGACRKLRREISAGCDQD